MKQIILILIILSFVSCKKEIEKENSEIKELNSKSSNPKTESNNLLSDEKENEEKTIIGDSPESTALTFINSYIADCNKMKESVGYLNFVKSSELTSSNFKTELQKIVDEAEKIDSEVGLDFDPIIDGQDYPDEGFQLKHFDSKTNFIVVEGKNWEDFEITLKLVIENNKWLVDGCGVINIPKKYQSKR